jgi:hypothetical protein
MGHSVQEPDQARNNPASRSPLNTVLAHVTASSALVGAGAEAAISAVFWIASSDAEAAAMQSGSLWVVLNNEQVQLFACRASKRVLQVASTGQLVQIQRTKLELTCSK